MLSLYQIRLELLSPLATNLASGTIFGHLCWAYREKFSDAELVKWLNDIEHLWAVSDGFPMDLLPRPLIKPQPFIANPNIESNDLKAIKKKNFIAIDGFKKNRLNLGKDLEQILELRKETNVRTAHNSINRKTGTTPSEGGLYFLDEMWVKPQNPRPIENDVKGTDPKDRFRDLYINAPANSQDLIKELFKIIGQNGYGKDATTGRGQWLVSKVEKNDALNDRNGNRCISLSRGVVDDENMHDIRCKLETHYGRTSANHANLSPFKYPLLLSLPGMTFNNSNAPRYGKIITGVHPERPEIIHNGLHVTLTYSE